MPGEEAALMAAGGEGGGGDLLGVREAISGTAQAVGNVFVQAIDEISQVTTALDRPIFRGSTKYGSFALSKLDFALLPFYISYFKYAVEVIGRGGRIGPELFFDFMSLSNSFPGVSQFTKGDTSLTQTVEKAGTTAYDYATLAMMLNPATAAAGTIGQVASKKGRKRIKKKYK